MGFFGELFYAEGTWQSESPDRGPHLRIEIHDSDRATIELRPAKGASGRFYLGYEPRVYFEDDDASAPVDRAAEAAGFTCWAHDVLGTEVDPVAIEALMASPDPDDEPSDAFVEQTVKRLLVLAGLPVPDGLPG